MDRKRAQARRRIRMENAARVAGLAFFALLACPAAEDGPRLDAPPAAFGPSEVSVSLDASALKHDGLTAAWIVSLNKTVVAQKESAVEFAAGEQQGSFKAALPEVKAAVTLQLDAVLSANGKALASARTAIRVFPRGIGRTLAAELKGKTCGVFDPSEAAAAQLQELGFKAELITSTIGLGAFKGDVLLLAGEGARSGLDIWERLKARMAAGLGVIVLAPEKLKAETISPHTLKIVASGQATVAPAAEADWLLAGLEEVDLRRWQPHLTRCCELPKSGSFRVLFSAQGEAAGAAILELPLGRGRLVVCSQDLLRDAADDPVALHILANLLVYASRPPPEPGVDEKPALSPARDR